MIDTKPRSEYLFTFVVRSTKGACNSGNVHSTNHPHSLSLFELKSENEIVIFTVFACRCILHWYLETEVLQYVVCSCPPDEVPCVRSAELLSFTLSCLGLMGHCRPLRRLIKF